MTAHNHTLKITTPDAWPPGAPVSNPPLYKFDFGGGKASIHQFGHIWLGPDQKPVTIRLHIIQSPGFVFQNDGVSQDGSLAIFTSNDPAAKLAFNGLGAAFQNPTLDDPPPNCTKLSFTVDYADPGAPAPSIFYYQLNVLDPNGVLVTWDPIVVNQP